MSQEEINPLDPIHKIHFVTQEARSIANALCMLGIPAGDDLHGLLRKIDKLAKEASDAVCIEANQRYVEASEQAGRTMTAILESCLQGTPD